MPFPSFKNLKRIVIGIDPAVTQHTTSDETGIIIAGVCAEGNGYVLEDLSCKASPLEWAQKVVHFYWQLKADCIVAETNNGGDLVAAIIKSVDKSVKVKDVKALKGKGLRAEPIVALYQQGRVFHIKPLPFLEEQMFTFIPGESKKSPDRLDALVWALSELLLSPSPAKKAPHIWNFNF